MSSDFTSRGVKRKLENEEDGGLDDEEGRRKRNAKLLEKSSPLQPPVPMVSPPRSSGSSNLQRQHIFNSSLCKLSRSRQSSDPSLLRSVLICNTLRMLEKELEREGYKINFGPNGVSFISPVPPPQAEMLDLMPSTFQSVPPPPPPPPCSPFVDSSIAFSPSVAPVPMMAEEAAAIEPVPESAIAEAVLSSEPTAPVGESPSFADGNTGDSSFDYDKYFAQMDGTTLPSGRATPFLRNYTTAGTGGEEEVEAVLAAPQTYNSCESPVDSPSVTVVAGQLTSANNPLMTITCTTTTASSSVNSSPTTQSSTNSLSSSPSSPSSSTFSLSPSSSLSSSSTSSYLVPSYVSYSSGSDEIFGDIDLSLYDFDIFSPLSPPSSTSKTTIPLMSAEELMREVNGISLGNSANNSFSSSSSASLSSSSSSSSSSLLSIGHDPNSVAFSGQISFITSSYCSSTPSSLMSSSSSSASLSSSNTSSSSSSLSSSCPSSTTASCPPSATTQPTAQPANCASSASAASATTGAPAPLHLHSASAR